MKSSHIPQATIQRLSIYIQVLDDLLQEGKKVISSEELAHLCQVNSSQIRKDLAYFGEFGVRGIGYYVQDLSTAIKQSLSADRIWNVALVGVGNLGRALLRSRMFRRRGYLIVGAFDCDPFKIGEEIAGLDVLCTQKVKEKIAELNIEIGIVSTPQERAQRAVDHLIEGGIKGIINFTPARVRVPEHIALEQVDFIHHLFSASFNIQQNQTKGLI